MLAAYAGRVVGYLPDYEAVNYSHIDLTALTQLNYFSITPTSAGAMPAKSTSGYGFSQMSSEIALAHAAGVPVSITLDPGTAYTTLDASSTLIATLASNLVTFCKTYHLDGIDLDWEPSSATTAQINNFTALIQSLYAQTSANGLTLSAAVSASQHIVTTTAAADLTWICVMDYDLEYNSSAPYSDSVTYMNSWASTGIPKSKLVEGVPFYGRAGTSWSNSQTAQYGTLMSEYAAANNGALPGTNVDSITIDGTTWGFNSVSDVQEKAQFVLTNGFGGMGVWEMGQDDFTASQSSYNLMAAIKSAMASTAPSWQLAGSGSTFSSFAMSNGDAGGLTVGAGTVTLAADAGAALSSFAATVETGGTLALASTQHLATLTLNGGDASYTASGSGVVEAGAVSITGATATLDLGTHDMIVHNGNLAQLTAGIASGFNLAKGGSWNGAGITSSAAAANAGRALGIELNSNGSGGTLLGSFDGQAVTATDVLIKYTFFGDADLSGTVDAADYALIDSGFNLGLTGWHNGDFNYDGIVNGDDYSLLDNAFNTQNQAAAAGLPVGADGITSAIASGAASTATALHEPAAGARALPDATLPLLSPAPLPLASAAPPGWASSFADAPIDQLLQESATFSEPIPAAY